jgi:hypothetical protein
LTSVTQRCLDLSTGIVVLGPGLRATEALSRVLDWPETFLLFHSLDFIWTHVAARPDLAHIFLHDEIHARVLGLLGRHQTDLVRGV